jgi:hypothetical protein
MAANSKIFLQRDIKVYAAKKGTDFGYAIPTLEGISFSQAVNNATITINEASPDGSTQRRGSAAFATDLAPAEWSFQTYLRPTLDGSATYAAGDRDNGATHGAIEEFLWAALAGDLGTATLPTDSVDKVLSGWTFGTQSAVLDFSNSNKIQLGKFDLLFALAGKGSGVSADENVIYHLDEAVVNEVSIDFDIDGIATCTWSGFAKKISEVNDGARPDGTTAGWFGNIDTGNVITEDANTLTKQNTSTSNFIQNRLSVVEIQNDDTNQDPNSNYNDTGYTLTLTGGNITISNNISYVTPSMMQTVNQPLGHIAGSRTITGNLTCYADHTANHSMDLYEDLQEASVFDATNSFRTKIFLGGKNSAFLPTAPGALFAMPSAHLDIPVHNIEDVVSFDINFTALASNATHTIDSATGAFDITADPTAMNDLAGTNELFVVMAGTTA